MRLDILSVPDMDSVSARLFPFLFQLIRKRSIARVANFYFRAPLANVGSFNRRRASVVFGAQGLISHLWCVLGLMGKNVAPTGFPGIIVRLFTLRLRNGKSHDFFFRGTRVQDNMATFLERRKHETGPSVCFSS